MTTSTDGTDNQQGSTTLQGVRLELSLTCRKCRNPVPLNGLCESLSCPSCGEVIDHGVTRWLSFFDPEIVAAVLGMDEGSGREISTLGGTSTAGSLVHLPPRCPRCEQDLVLDQLPELAEAGGTTCSCGQWIDVREAPPLARVIIPGARWVVDEHLGGDDDGTDGAAKPLLFTCMGCGGSLKIDGRERTVACTWCGADNFLPDALWQRMHPVPKVLPFTIVTALSLDDRLRLQAAGEDVHLTRDDDLPRDLFEKLATSDERAARVAVAGNLSAPADLLDTLSRDDDADVREALARNPSLDQAAVWLLVRDDDDDVRRAIASRPELSCGALDVLLFDHDWEVRQYAAAHPGASVESLVALAAKESDSDVLAALGHRQDLDAQVLRALGQGDQRDAMQIAAGHPATPPDVLAGLVGEWDLGVRKRLAVNPSTPASALFQLAQDDDASVASAARASDGFAAASRGRGKKRLLVTALVFVVLACAGLAGVIAAAVGVATGYLQLAL